MANIGKIRNIVKKVEGTYEKQGYWENKEYKEINKYCGKRDYWKNQGNCVGEMKIKT